MDRGMRLRPSQDLHIGRASVRSRDRVRSRHSHGGSGAGLVDRPRQGLGQTARSLWPCRQPRRPRRTAVPPSGQPGEAEHRPPGRSVMQNGEGLRDRVRLCLTLFLPLLLLRILPCLMPVMHRVAATAAAGVHLERITGGPPGGGRGTSRLILAEIGRAATMQPGKDV